MKPILRIELVHRKSRQELWVHTLPSKRHLLRISSGKPTESSVLEVSTVVYDLTSSGRVRNIEVHAKTSKRSLSPRELLVSRFEQEFTWRHKACVPQVWDSVRLHDHVTSKDFDPRVLNVIHDINRVRKTHTIKVQVTDASPKPVFSPEDIEAAFRPGPEELKAWKLWFEDQEPNANQ